MSGVPPAGSPDPAGPADAAPGAAGGAGAADAVSWVLRVARPRAPMASGRQAEQVTKPLFLEAAFRILHRSGIVTGSRQTLYLSYEINV